MNAASYIHSIVHTHAVLFLTEARRDLRWLIDFDFRLFLADGMTLIRPDICGIREDDSIETAVEISKSTLSYDLGEKKAVYEQFGVQTYIVLDCVTRTVHQFALSAAGRLEPCEPMTGLHKVFKLPRENWPPD